MMKTLVLALGLALSLGAQAKPTLNSVVSSLNNTVAAAVEAQGAFNWVVGDTSSYKLNMGGFISGSMVMTVKVVEPARLVLGQDMDLGFMGKQSCEMTLNPQTGKTEKLVCNGQDQSQAEQGTVEVIDSKEDTITVPAGQFTCLYIKAKSTSQGKETIIQQWANPKLVPVMGLVKALTPSQFGEVKVELSSFHKN